MNKIKRLEEALESATAVNKSKVESINLKVKSLEEKLHFQTAMFKDEAIKNQESLIKALEVKVKGLDQPKTKAYNKRREIYKKI